MKMFKIISSAALVSVSATTVATSTGTEAQYRNQYKHIKPVVIALDDLKKSMISELKQWEKDYECQVDFCKKDISGKKWELEEASSKELDSKSIVEDSKAKAGLLGNEVSKLNKEI